MTSFISRLSTKFLILMLLSIGMVGAWAVADEDELLDPDDAFAFSAVVNDANSVTAKWKIDPRYYMYRTRISFKSGSDQINLGEPDFPTGKIKNDEFFGEIETYRGEISVAIPLERLDDGTELVLKARSQGCADAGVCYPPHDQEITLTLPAASVAIASAAPEAPKTGSLNMLSNLADTLTGGAAEEDEFLDPEVAFRPLLTTDKDGNIVAEWEIADGYYLYRDRLKFKKLEGEGISIADPVLTKGKTKNDEFFGEVEVYYKKVRATLPTDNTTGGDVTAKLEVGYQGCADAGLCYPPEKKQFEVVVPASASGQVASSAAEPVSTKTIRADGDAEPSASEGASPVSEQDRIASIIAGGSFWLIIATFFGFGLLLAFTPCVFPMIPILSSIIVGQGDQITTQRAFILSLIYVLAMALTYTVAGVVVGMLGAEFNLQAAFQNPWILGSFVLIFVLLAFSMFGFYEIQLPSALQSRLTEISNHQKGGSYAGVAIMGLLSALIVGPCVAPPLMGALIYIGQTGDAVLGGTALFALSMGMGAPLLAIGASAGKFLPRAGAWMDAVKAVFGVMLLAVGLWLLERVVPIEVTMLLWAILLISSAVYMGALEPLPPMSEGGWNRLWKGIGLVLLIYGGLQLVGLAAGGKDWMQPLSGISTGGGSGGASEAQEVKFKKIKSLDDLNQAVEAANATGKTVMLDFYADWCTDCKRMEKYTFTQSNVINALDNTIAVKADVTDNDDIDKALMKHFDIIGPPAILFFGLDGAEKKNFRVVGFMEADEFSAHIEKTFR